MSAFLLRFISSILLLTLAAFETSAQNPFYYILLPKVFSLDSEHNVNVFIASSASARLMINAKHVSTKEIKSIGPYFINGGSGTVKVHVPFTKYTPRSIIFEFKLHSCGSSASETVCMRNPAGAIVADKTVELPVIASSLLVFTEFEKPIFKPDDTLKFRVLPLYLNSLSPKKTENSLNIDLVYLESPSRRRMAQWRNVHWLDALVGFSFPLSSDPVFGSWKVVTQIKQQTDNFEVQVKPYVKPQFTVTLKPPSYMIATDKSVEFHVCAKYSTGLPMKGTAWAQLSLRGYTDKRPVIVKTAEFNGIQDCITFTESTDKLQLRSTKYYSSTILLNATVTEDGTGAKVRESVEGGQVSYTFFKVKLESDDIYYPGLPYDGRARTLNHDGTPRPNSLVKVRLHHWTSRYGYFKALRSDKSGLIKFVIPPIPTNVESVTLSIAGAEPQAIPYERGLKSVWAPYASITLKKAFSPTNTSLRITPLYKMPPQDPCVSKVLKLRLSANVRLLTRTIHVVAMARGEIFSRATISPETDPSVKECQNADSEEEGHYVCQSRSGDDRGFYVTCLDGYTGTNCLTPVCRHRCVMGACGSPSKCICKEGWTGDRCTICVPRLGCANGFCAYGNDCHCQPGWTGTYCNKLDKNRYFNSRIFDSIQRRKPCAGDCLEKDTRYAASDPTRVERASIFRREIEVPWMHSVSPSADVIVYFQYDDKEIVSASVELPNLTTCLNRAAPTKFEFSSKEVRPGASLSGSIATTGTEPKCALSISDIAMRTFGSSGGVSTEEVLDQINEIMKKVNGYHEKDFYSTRRNKLCSESKKRVKRTVIDRPSSSGGRDSSSAFDEGGLIILSNVEVISKPCNLYGGPIFLDGPVMMRESDAAGAGVELMRKTTSVESKPKATNTVNEEVKSVIKPKIRTFFPETWKFLFLDKPSSSLALTAPDSMTTWEANMYCVSSLGLGISPPTSLKVFQPFFIQMVLPYSLIRGEVAQIPVKVFNYIDSCYEVILTLKMSTDFKIIGHDFEEFCICGFERKTAYFYLKATSVKSTTIEVLAIPSTSANGLCAQKSLTTSSLPSDAVRRDILLEPEGIPQEINVGDVVCAGDAEKTFGFDLNTIKDTLVPDSARAYLSWSGDMFGPALDNLDKIVRMPYGCGEQNMVTMVPSIYVLTYFTNSGIENGEIDAKARKYIHNGYERQLRYQYPDGSYSAFRSSSGSGSTWLTTFVLKSFIEGQKFVKSIQTSVLNQAITFLLSKQRRNCIYEDGKVYSQYLKGGMSASNSDTATMTAYVLSGLLEARTNAEVGALIKDSAITNAVRCISDASTALTELPTYSLALRAYALIRWNKNDALTTRYMDEFSRRVVPKGDLKYVPENKNSEETPAFYRPWMRYSAADVEVTAYYILCQFHRKDNPKLVDMLPYLRWLTTNRNNRGGWFSTQDTVVALQALSKCATLISGTGGVLNLNLAMQYNGASVTENLGPSNKLIYNRRSINSDTNVKVTPTGSGCALIQLSLLFNAKNFQLHARVSPFAARGSVVLSPDCNTARMQACMRYRPPSSGSTTTMVIMQTKMASGWRTTERSLSALRGTIKEGALQLVEEEKDKSLVLYFDPVTNAEVCAEFGIERFVEVLDVMPMIVQVYDYYQPEQVVEISVKIQPDTGICKDKMTYKPKETTTETSTCPRCASTVATAAQVLTDQCASTSTTLIWMKRSVTTENKWKIRLYSPDKRVLGWESQLTLPSECSCTLDKEIVLSSQSKKEIVPGQPVVVDGSWSIIDGKQIKTAYNGLSANCKQKLNVYPITAYLHE